MRRFYYKMQQVLQNATFIANCDSTQKQSPEVLYRKGVLKKTFAKFTGKHLRHSLPFNEVAGLRPATILKRRLWHRCFPVNFAKFLRTPFLHNTSGLLLLYIMIDILHSLHSCSFCMFLDIPNHICSQSIVVVTGF